MYVLFHASIYKTVFLKNDSTVAKETLDALLFRKFPLEDKKL